LNRKRICADDKIALDAINIATQEKGGGTVGNQNASKTTDNNVNSRSKRSSPAGNNSQQALRRLRKDAPKLHAKVLAGKLSPQSKKGDTRKHRLF
jgi:hypothetical protein